MSAREAAGEPETGGAGLGTYAELAAVVLFWACNWVFIRPALRDVGPLAFNALRVVIAALPIAGLLLARRIPLMPVRGERWPMAVVGFFQVAGILTCGATGVQYVPGGRASVLAYTMQIWALPLGALIAGDRLTWRHLPGGILAVLGILVLFNPTVIDWHDPHQVFGNAILVGAALCWAMGACLYRRRRVWHSSFWTLTFWQFFTSALVMIPLAVVGEGRNPIHWTLRLDAILVANGVIGTAVSYWLYARALSVLPAAQVGQILSLVPFVALAMSAALFAEPLTPLVGLGIVLIGAGILTTMRAGAALRTRAAVTR